MKDIGTIERPTFFGPPEKSVFGVVHMPEDGRVRGTALICPPLAKEHFDTVRGLRLLADRIASAGFAVLRFDYYGTGDSALSSERDDIVSQWLESIQHAAAYLRDLSAGDLAIVGLRAGALLACAALPTIGSVGSVALWDPVGRGKTYLREQSALYTMTVGGEKSSVDQPHLVPLIGTTLTSSARREFALLSVDSLVRSSADRWLVATRPGGGDQTIESFATAPGIDRIEVTGMPEFVQATDYLVHVPEDAIDEVAHWVTNSNSASRDVHLPTLPLRATADHTLASGVTIRERIEQLGPNQLFAIRTGPVVDASGRTVLLFATANDTHHGPNRAWVETARAVAECGAEAVRFDRRGTGESGRVVRGERTSPYSQTAIEDALSAARASGPPEKVLASGVCSGAWYAAHVGRHIRPDAVVLVNAIMWSWRHKRTVLAGRVNGDALGGVPRSDPAFERSALGRTKSFVKRWLPYPGWRMLGHAGITQVPEVLLRPVTEAGTDVTVVLAPHDAEWFDDQRGQESLLRLGRDVRMIRTGVGDHTAYHPEIRTVVADTILEWCRRS